MTRLAGLSLGAVMLPLISALPSAAGLSGDYTVTFYDGPATKRPTPYVLPSQTPATSSAFRTAALGLYPMIPA